MKIKICGITKEEEIEYLNEADVDYAGFVFFEKSKRNLSLQRAEKLMKGLNSNIKKVAVMVSPDVNMIQSLKPLGFDIYQIHKELSQEVLETVDKPVWYAVNIADETELLKKEQLIDSLPKHLEERIEAMVVDAPNFGSGQTFDWQKSKQLKKGEDTSGKESILERYTFVLAGGLNPGNVQEGIQIFNPDVVDVSSGVEGENGKEKSLIAAFVKAAKQ